ncbi:MAG: hypothetical protein HQK89_10580 [Nitrospirae bacterium]|nr:hypothetical protein [Nitrospirota bacterium]
MAAHVGKFDWKSWVHYGIAAQKIHGTPISRSYPALRWRIVIGFRSIRQHFPAYTLFVAATEPFFGNRPEHQHPIGHFVPCSGIQIIRIL